MDPRALAGGPPHHLHVAPNGWLWWLHGASPWVHQLPPLLRTVQLSHQGLNQSPLEVETLKVGVKVYSWLPSPSGGMFGFADACFVHVAPQATTVKGFALPPGVPRTHPVFDPATEAFYWADAGLNQLHAFQPSRRTSPSAKPVTRAFPLKKGVQVHGLALGPDGRLWVTLAAANKVARIDEQEAPRFYALAGSGAPDEIIDAPDGRLVITKLDRGCLVAFTVVPPGAPQGAAASASSAPSALPPSAPVAEAGLREDSALRPAQPAKQLTASQRRERQFRWEREAMARLQQLEAERNPCF